MFDFFGETIKKFGLSSDLRKTKNSFRNKKNFEVFSSKLSMLILKKLPSIHTYSTNY